MPQDPLGPFRARPRQAEPEPPELTEHQALKLAIEALNSVPNARVHMEGYRTTYDLLPELEKTYRAEEERLQSLVSSAPHVPMTDVGIDAAVEHDLKLWEDARQDRAQAPDIEPER
jgi:hypothetical protein